VNFGLYSRSLLQDTVKRTHTNISTFPSVQELKERDHFFLMCVLLPCF
jgi:hypothetical protein